MRLTVSLTASLMRGGPRCRPVFRGPPITPPPQFPPCWWRFSAAVSLRLRGAVQGAPWGAGEGAFLLPAGLEWDSAGSPRALQDERDAQEETGGLRVRNRVESKAGALQALPPGWPGERKAR